MNKIDINKLYDILPQIQGTKRIVFDSNLNDGCTVDILTEDDNVVEDLIRRFIESTDAVLTCIVFRNGSEPDLCFGIYREGENWEEWGEKFMESFHAKLTVDFVNGRMNSKIVSIKELMQ